MTPKERATMQQALSTDEAFAALELILKDGAEHGSWPLNKNCEDGLVALAALQEVLEHPHTPYCKQAPMCKTPCGNSDCLEQPVNQEPISYLCPSFVDNFATGRYETCDCKDYGAFPVYTAPQPVKEVELTDDALLTSLPLR